MTATVSTKSRANWLMTIYSMAVMCPLAMASLAHAATYTVVNINDSGAGSLRWAITQANVTAGTDTITFNITGAGPHTIQPGSALPALTDPMILDGYTQPGSSPATASSPAILKIELRGDLAGAGADGLTVSAGMSTVRGLVVNRFAANGIEVAGSGGNMFEGNHIGTNVDGNVDFGNVGDGIYIGGAPSNTVGGMAPAARNIISGNNDDGVSMVGSSCSENQVLGNYIGVNANGTGAVANGWGVYMENAPNNAIGGITSAARNVISGNYNDGVSFWGANATGNVIQGNYLGTDVTGAYAIGNLYGIYIEDAPGNTIGGTTSSRRNIISGNYEDGILIEDAGATGNVVWGNFIGTDVDGTVDLGNIDDGISIDSAPNTTIGGNTAGMRNIISGNNDDGIALHYSSTSGTVIQGNYIGTDLTGSLPLGNSLYGIYIGTPGSPCHDNIIGGPTPNSGNVIAYNGSDGILVDSGLGNSFEYNAIFSNGGLGIDLSPHGVTPNDPGDGDSGSNRRQNFPVLANAVTSATGTLIQGTLNSTSNTTFQVEFFANASSDPSNYGEGELPLGSVQVTTDVTGDVTFLSIVAIQMPAEHFVSATATSPTNDTSEFSAVIPAMAFLLNGTQTGAQLDLSWSNVPGNTEFWVYGASNTPYFSPDVTPPYQHRLDVLPWTTTTWSSTNGIADPDSNWTYLIIAVDATERELARSNRFGEFDFSTAGP